MNPLPQDALVLFEGKAEEKIQAPAHQKEMAQITFVATAALTYFGLLNPVTGLLIGAGCVYMAKSESTLFAESIQNAVDEFTKAGLNYPLLYQEKTRLVIISCHNEKTKLEEEGVDRKIQAVALNILKLKDGYLMYNKKDHAIGFQITFA